MDPRPRTGRWHVLSAIVLTLVAAPCAAQEEGRQESPNALQPVAVDSPAQTPLLTPLHAASTRRPTLLVPLYTSYAGLNALDLHSSRRALAQRSVEEANPIARALGSGALLMATKAAVTTGVIVAGERIRKKHPRAAVFLVSALDTMMTIVVAHNYSLHPNN